MQKLGGKKVLKDLNDVYDLLNYCKLFFYDLELMLENDSTKEDIKRVYKLFKNKVGVK